MTAGSGTARYAHRWWQQAGQGWVQFRYEFATAWAQFEANRLRKVVLGLQNDPRRLAWEADNRVIELPPILRIDTRELDRLERQLARIERRADRRT